MYNDLKPEKPAPPFEDSLQYHAMQMAENIISDVNVEANAELADVLVTIFEGIRHIEH